MLLKTRGIVLRVQKYSESSLIIKILTEERGVKTYIISGVRKAKAKVGAGIFQLMNVLDLVVYDKDTKSMQRIKEVRPHLVYKQIPFDVYKSSVGLFMIEVIQKTIKEEEIYPELFQYLYKVFSYLDQTDKNPYNLHLHFLLEYSGFLGFSPGGLATEEQKYFNLEEGSFTYSESMKHSLNEDESKLVSDLMHLSLYEAHTLQMDKIRRNSLLTNLLQFYKIHVDNFGIINSHQVLKEVFN